MKIKQPIGILHVGIYRHIYIYTHKHRYTHTIMYKPRAGDYESKKRLKSGSRYLQNTLHRKNKERSRAYNRTQRKQ